ncbi:MAG: GAF domain-containing sensor histidine kinase [Sulfuritalea sp.]|nr:GAF domain-containing sensor histidine kinase [Sulfuritalea sp.]
MKFAVLDDSDFFLKALEMEWEAIQDGYPDMEGQFVKLTAALDFAVQINPLKECQHLLLDVSVLDENSMRILADTLPDTFFWMMTGKANAEEVERWLAWTTENSRAKNQWFEKPLSLAEAVLPVWLAGTPSNAHVSPHPDLAAELNSFPIPCRWFSTDARPIHNNTHWRLTFDANPNRFSAEEIVQLKQGKSVTLDTWSEHPDQPGHFGKLRFVTHAWRDGYLQFGLSLPETRGDTVHQAVSDIFNFMIGSGNFTRARYYEILRVPGSNGVLRLCQASYPLDIALPAQQTLGPTMTRRVGQYDADFAKRQREPNGKARLNYYIREHENEAANPDPDIQFWQQQAKTGQAPWLALPICRKRQELASALLVFDRLGKGTGAGADDYDGEGISDELVKNLGPKLLGSIHHLRRVMEQEDIRERLDRREAMAKWRAEFAAAVDQRAGQQSNSCLNHLEQMILDAAIELTQADSALLALRPPAANYLESRGQSDSLMGGLRLNYGRPRFLAVGCALSKAPVYVPDFQRMPTEDAITDDDWRDALAHLAFAEQEKRLPELAKWQKRQLGSVIALPMKYDDTLLGVLVLRHRKPHFFTAERVAVAESLVREAHPFLRRARALTARDAWDSMIFHEMRSGLSHIRGQADWVLRPSTSRIPQDAAQAILSRTELMTDLSNEILVMLGYPDKRSEPRRYERDNPLDLLKTLWTELGQLPEATGKSVDSAGGKLPWAINDPNNALPHVLRVLLENALRYGEPGVIQATQSSETGHWHLCLCNPGQFSEDILKGQFTGLSDREDLAQDSLRAHIGLATCRRVLEGLGGSLELKNRPAQETGQAHACVTLIWPYVAPEAANRGDTPAPPSGEPT